MPARQNAILCPRRVYLAAARVCDLYFFRGRRVSDMFYPYSRAV